MEFYFRKNGQTVGPFSVFRVRDMLEKNDLLPVDIGWHEGMDEWLPLENIPALNSLLPKKEQPEGGILESGEGDKDDFLPDRFYEPEPVEKPESKPVVTAIPRAEAMLINQTILRAKQLNARAWQRFFARFIDLTIFSLIAWCLGAASGLLEHGEVWNPRFIALLLPPFLWIPFEAIFLAVWGATPGKALLGLHVVNADGEKLSFRQAFLRSFDVWFVGCGMELPILNILLKVMSLFRYRQLGETSWDAALGSKVIHRPVTSIGITLAVLLMVSSFFVRVYVFFNAPLPSHLPPEDRKFWEQIHPSNQPVETKPSETSPPAANERVI